MAFKAPGAALALVLAILLATGGSADAQGTNQRTSRISRNPGGGTNPAILVRCFVPNCGRCNNFNPYLCAQCNVGYQLTGAFSCNSCAPGFFQNLEVQTFTCSACPSGTTSPGGTGEGSQCVPITTALGRRLLAADAEEDLWA
jgi:hypothetical protein